jgi:hypothetical protein
MRNGVVFVYLKIGLPTRNFSEGTKQIKTVFIITAVRAWNQNWKFSSRKQEFYDTRSKLMVAVRLITAGRIMINNILHR